MTSELNWTGIELNWTDSSHKGEKSQFLSHLSGYGTFAKKQVGTGKRNTEDNRKRYFGGKQKEYTAVWPLPARRIQCRCQEVSLFETELYTKVCQTEAGRMMRTMTHWIRAKTWRKRRLSKPTILSMRNRTRRMDKQSTETQSVYRVHTSAGPEAYNRKKFILTFT